VNYHLLTHYIYFFYKSKGSKYNDLIIKYMGARLGMDNIVMAICHADEGGLRHLHLDILPITAEGKLSAKTLITRDFITSIHKLMPII